MQVEHLGLLVAGTLSSWRPSFTPRAWAAAKPDFTRSRMRSRSNSARPAMMVRMSLPLAVPRSKLNPVCASTLTFQL